MIIGVLLAGGKGSRFKSKGFNKTATSFHGKPLIQYGADLYEGIVNKTCVVVGAHKDTVVKALSYPDSMMFVEQKRRLGTGHAIKKVILELEKKDLNPSLVLVGNGDHMMFYKKEILKKVIKSHVLRKHDITFITTTQKNPAGLGRIVRNKKGNVTKIVEEKDATPMQRKIKEINAGFYCFNYDFLKKNYKSLAKSQVTGEYYITEFIHMAITQNLKVHGHKIPFKYVGYGINTREDFSMGLSLFSLRDLSS